LKVRRGFFLSFSLSDTPHYEQVLFEVPEGWESVPVSELFCLNPKSEISDDTGVGFIPMTCVDDGFSGNHSFEERIWKEVKKGYCHFQNGDIGVAKISPCFENLKSTIFQNLPNNYGAGTTELVILRPINVCAKFYLYLFKSKWYIDEGTKYFKGVVGQQRVHKGIFTDLQIPLPPLAEQQRIITEIERWFSLIDIIENDKDNLQATIKQAKSKILDLAIHGKLIPQDPNDEPAIDLLKRINPDFTPCDNGHNEKLPQGWMCCQLSNVLKITMGQSPKGDSLNNNSGIEFHQGKICFSDKYLQKSEILTDEPIKITEPNSVLLCVRAPVGVVNITKTRICIGRGLCSLSPFEGNSDFYFYLLQTLQDSFENQSTGTTFKAISGEIIKNEKIILPPLAEQQRIVHKIEELFSVLDNIQNALEV
jgi:type I restriction enzyme S subunit